MERSSDRRAAEVLHDDHHRTERLCCRSPRPHAGSAVGEAVRAVAERRGGRWYPEARAERLPAALARLQARQQFEG